jgi:hypothetical protein
MGRDYMRKVALIVLIIIVICLPVYAEIGGYVSVEYDTLNQDWLWVLNVDKQLTPWFKVGTALGTYSEGFGFKHFVPSWIPHRLDYEVYAEVHYKNFSLRVTDWCDHWFAQSDQDWLADRWGLTVRLRYDF